MSDRRNVVKSTAGPRTAIRPVGALHCTLGVMSLTKDQLSQATSFLENLDVRSLLSGTVRDSATTSEQGTTDTSSARLVVDLKGLESMHAPEKTSILYSGPFDKSERLYPFCLAVQQLFQDKGFLVEDDRKLKLHATIVNTIYAKGKKLPGRRASNQAQQNDSDAQGHGPNANAPLKLDARALLDEYQDFAWAENVTLNRLAICEMGAKKITDDEGKVIAEQYTEVASIGLPS
ncbi:hypothetical protein PRZ48_000880 [Zasmidium cellare]|uniref:A-kinase anchor protein 7-like phosphoesterase domain-containing protein n=1 Tax=Zasmidium cellare TaxID=395010 RepID=A0ABR0F187_ZASCE|nr:hypothetical protein PRZ48_000880 [Zasmidium cellare]